MSRVLHLMRKELLELRQDPRLFGIVILAPILQLTRPRLCGDHGRQGRADRRRRRRPIGREPRADHRDSTRLTTSPSSAWSARPTRSIDWLERGERGWRSAFRRGTASRSRAARRRRIQVVADGTDSNSTNVALGYARSLIGGYAQDLLGGALGGRAPEPLVTAGDPRLVQPGSRKPRLHDPGHRGAAAAGHHHQPVGHGDRSREGAWHARAAERDAAGSGGS